MKSSVCGILPWTRTPGPKCDTTSNPVKSRSGIDSGNMKETMYGNQPQQQKRQLYSKLKPKVPPFLRLDSQGEIDSHHNFCDKSVKFQSFNKLGFSNSFDSSKKSKNHIPHPHRPFHKSNSIPANLRMPAHQSFPPPSSLSAIRSNSFSCPAAEKFSPFSSSPRNLGHVDVFGGNCNNNSDPQQCSISPFSFDGCKIMNCSKKIDADKFQPSCSKVGVQESKVKCNGIGNMASVKSDMSEKIPQFDHSDGKVSANRVECDNPSTQNSMNCSSSSSSYCSSPNAINCSEDKDLSYVLFLRKPKKRRARNKRRNRRQKQDGQSFVPSSCSSPIKDDSKAPSPTQRVNIDDSPIVGSPIYHNTSAGKCQTSACEIPTSSPSKSCSSFIVFASADSDHSTQLEQFSDDDFDSVVFSDDTNSPSRKSGKKRKYKHKQSQKQEKTSEAEDTSDLESDIEQQNSSLSGLCFTFVSLSVSEDEDNDSSVDWGDLSTSPSASDPQLIFEFEFNTGLSLEAIIGQNTSTDCPTLSKELRDLNVRWNKLYASTTLDSDISQHHQKVHFAGDEDLVTVHIVGDEDRGGEWHHYATERARFQKKIKDIETVVAPVLCVNHRAKVFERLGVRA